MPVLAALLVILIGSGCCSGNWAHAEEINAVDINRDIIRFIQLAFVILTFNNYCTEGLIKWGKKIIPFLDAPGMQKLAVRRKFHQGLFWQDNSITAKLFGDILILLC